METQNLHPEAQDRHPLALTKSETLPNRNVQVLKRGDDSFVIRKLRYTVFIIAKREA